MSTHFNAHDVVVCALYRFVGLEDYQDIQEPLLNIMKEQGVRGTLLLAHEGINGTIAGSRQGIDAVLAWLKQDERFAALSWKESYVDEIPFLRARVKLKKEIVTMGVQGIDPTHVVGTYVNPKDWNALISDPDVVLVDTRNAYEYNIGTFQGALNPETETFREFPDYLKKNLDPNKHKKVAMFCTGGIRCEKSTAYAKEQGFEEVYHLEGGILKYLEEVPESESLWQGECFVFDNRVAVNHNLEKGQYDQCYACRYPITEDDKLRPEYEKGVSCHHCYAKKTDEQRERYAARERQMQLARERGENHMGADSLISYERNRQEKRLLKEKQRAQSAAQKTRGK